LGIHDLWLFLAAGLLLNVTPGPDMALIIARSTQQGTHVGVAAALGVGVGAFVHITGAAIGLSAILVTSAFAFTILKWAGALYLIFLGLQMLRASFGVTTERLSVKALPSVTIRQAFIQGILTNVLNPKVAAFFLAFLPQFVDPDAPSKILAFVTLGLLFDVVGTTWNLAVAWFAGRLAASRLYGHLKVWLDRAIGAIFIGVGLKLAIAERP
jgi:threonine/homoserine/homoserine lactone efflux protein